MTKRFPAQRFSAATFASVYIVLLLLVPSRLVLRQIGAAGTPANLWGIMALLWWMSATVGGQIKGRKFSPVRTALGLLAICVLVSYGLAMAKGWYIPAGVKQVTDEVYDLLPPGPIEIRGAMVSAADRGLIALAAWMGIALVVCDGLRDRNQLTTLLRTLTAVAGVMAALGIFQYFTGYNIASLVRVPGFSPNVDIGGVQQRSILRRINVTALHPIEFGVVMGAIFPLALHRAIFRAGRRIDLLPAIAIGVAIPLSVSRSAVLVLAVGLAIMFIGWPPRWRVQFFKLAPVAIVATRVALPGVVGTILSLFRNASSDPSVTGRTDDYDITFRLIDDNVWFGRGLFTFVPRYYRILDNQFLMFLLELGFVGLVAFIGLSLTAFYSARGARRRTDDPEFAHACLAISAAIIGIVVSYLTFDAWGFPMAAGLTFLLFGIAGAAWRIARDEESAAVDDAAAGETGDIARATAGP